MVSCSNSPSISKVALWIDLNSINGEKVDYTYSYWKNIKSKVGNSNFDVIVLLIKAGEYDFIVSSKSNSKYKKYL